MDWKTTVKDCVEKACASKTHVSCVVSPDVDGILSILVLTEYFRRKSISTSVIGIYDSEKLVTTHDSVTGNMLRNALWVDLDVRFSGVKYAIGQHYIGNVETEETTFNPNTFFSVNDNYGDKYPYGTVHLLLWSLFDSEIDAFPILKEKYSIARALFSHADSAYLNVKKYWSNTAIWAFRLFPDPSCTPNTLQYLIDKTYFNETGLSMHINMLRQIRPYVEHDNDEILSSWKNCGGHQTTGTISKTIGLLAYCSKELSMEPPYMNNESIVFWKGTRTRIKRYLLSKGNTLEEELRKRNVMSHAIVNINDVSITVGKNPFV